MHTDTTVGRRSPRVSLTCLAGLLLVAGTASQAAEVTLYGVVDVGATHVSNEGGASVTRLSSGDLQQSRFGFRGTESLGAGYEASFMLENGFNADTGAMASAGVLFSREASLSLKAPWGTVSLGRQAAPLVDVLLPFTAAMLVYGPGYYTTHPGDYDRTLNVPVDNSVKYRTPTIAGFTGSVMYGFGEQAGATSAQSTWSTGLSYVRDRWTVGAAFLQSHGSNLATVRLAPAANPFGSTGANDLVNTYGLGVSHRWDSFTLFGQVNQAKFRLADLTPRTYEIGAKWNPLAPWTFGADLSSTSVRERDARLRVLSLSANYAFSKRTDAYVIGAAERASGSNSAGTPLVAQLFTLGASSTPRQQVLRVALRHRF